MAGIYIHVPFCYKRCYYCDFYSSVNTKLADDFIKALDKEISIRKNFFDSYAEDQQVIHTIYLGGGTPSLLTIKQLDHILQNLHANFKISENSECTIEVNPDDLNFEYLQNLRKIGFNRLSIGIQSFDNDLLKFMNRRHDASQAEISVKLAQEAGFNIISIDLIYGLPEMSLEQWENALIKAFSLNVQHISAYHLGIEKGTVFGKWKEQGKLKEIGEELSWQQFKLLNELTAANGFEHYEISNLAKPNFRSRHNTAYWNDIPFLGAGPSAHSYNGSHRLWNVSNINLYIQALESGKNFSENEELSAENKRHELIMTRLRTYEGIDLIQFARQFGKDSRLKLENAAADFIRNGYALVQENKLFLNLKGWFISDKIISDLMF